jgi:hypothetical protein
MFNLSGDGCSAGCFLCDLLQSELIPLAEPFIRQDE